MGFTYADLFAGIGGFHAALSALGGECRFVAEIDDDARQIYGQNWGHDLPTDGTSGRRRALDSDIVPLTEEMMSVPKTDVLAAGFPCQPFSKSGFQRGINETRGTLFFNILRILQERRPPVVLLENVRNLAGPRHADTWTMIVRQLRDAGYKVSSAPTVFSPHFLPPDHGGTPQVRDRVFILGTYVGSAEKAWALSDDLPVVARGPVVDVDGKVWDPQSWDPETTPLYNGLPLLQPEGNYTAQYKLTRTETGWINVWDRFVQMMWEEREGERLPGFPLWAEAWVPFKSLVIPRDTPGWKADFLIKNSKFYDEHVDVITDWQDEFFPNFDSRDDTVKWTTKPLAMDGVDDDPQPVQIPASRRKLEWQAQDEGSLWDCVMHFRPSGIRAKRSTYLPALVAITQTSVIGKRRRRLTPVEAARLQGLPDEYSFEGQPDAATYKQLGNGVSVGAAYYVLRAHVEQDRELIPAHIVSAVLSAQPCPKVTMPSLVASAQADVASRGEVLEPAPLSL
jgi:DNA (cytosine-5)-methyltransferase 1